MKEVWRTSSKIMVVVMLCTSILSAAIGGLVLYQSSKVVEKSVYKDLEMTAENYASVFSNSTETVETTLNSYLSAINGSIDYAALSSNPDTYLRGYRDQVLVPITKQFAVDNKADILGIYFDFDPGIPVKLDQNEETYGAWYLDKRLNGKIEQNSMELKKNFYPDNEKMGWYYAAVKNKAGVWSKPYIDVYTGYHMISYNAPLYYNDRLIGVAGIDMTFESVKSIIEKFKVLDTGYAFLLSGDYDVIVEPEVKSIGEDSILSNSNSGYEKLIAVIKEGTSKSLYIGKSSNGKVLSYGKMSNGYIFVIEVKSREIFKELNYIRALIDTIILIGITLCAVAAYLLGKYIAKPVDEAQRRIHKLFCQDLQKDTRKIELRRNSEGQKMLDEIEYIRTTTEKLIFSLKDNMNQEELVLERLELAINKLSIIMERMQQNMGANAEEKIINDFRFGESTVLFEQISKLLNELTAINERYKKLGSIYYLDERTVQVDKDKE